MSFLLEPFFSSFIPLLVAFDQRVNGSICFEWHHASLSLLFNSPRTTSLALSHIIACAPHSSDREGTMPNVLHSSASLGMSMTGQSCYLDTVVANNVSLNMLSGNLLYRKWWSFVLNCQDKDGCNTMWTPYYVVWWIILNASSQMAKSW